MTTSDYQRLEQILLGIKARHHHRLGGDRLVREGVTYDQARQALEILRASRPGMTAQ